MARLSESTRWRIVGYHESGATAAWISRKLRLNIKSVYLWIGRHAETGSVGAKRPRGRPAAMDTQARKRAVQLLLSQEYGGARYVARQLFAEKRTDWLVAASTLIRGAKAQAVLDGEPLSCLRGRPGKELTAVNKEQRVAFARANIRRDWARVMITDRCKFAFRYPGAKVLPVRWVTPRRRDNAVAYRPNKASVYNVYAGISKYGVTRLHTVTGTTRHISCYRNQLNQAARNITKAEYRDVVTKTLLPEGRRIFSTQGLSSWVLQQDGDPTHGAARHEVQAWNTKGQGSVDLLQDWPGNSPDLSPIENVWGWVDGKVAAMGCKTFEEFKAAVDLTFTSIPKQMLVNLWASIPKRLQLVIDNGGEKCGY